jgi:hypothetical protein
MTQLPLCLYVHSQPQTNVECLNQSLRNLERLSCHLSPSERHNYEIPLISSTNTTASQVD